MLRTLMKSKLHRATVTAAELEYMGSITLDPLLMEAADIVAGERVQVLDLNNGARFETYVITGERDSGQVVLNGPAARLVAPGDQVMVVSYGIYDEREVREHRSVVVFCDEDNRPLASPPGEPGAARQAGQAQPVAAGAPEAKRW